MNKFDSFIEKRNFKRVFIIYVIAAIICGIVCVGFTGFVFREKIELAIRYERTAEVLKNQNSDEKIRQSIDNLANASNDICDILILDEKNNIIYSAKKSNFAKQSVFELKKADGSRFLQSSENSNDVFRYAKKDEFMLDAIFADKFKEIYDEYDEDGFYLDNFQNKKLYMISFLGQKGGKAYIISDPQPVRCGMLSLKIDASIFMFLFMIYMIIIALWVYQDARKSKLSAPIWGIITLFTNLAGVIVYLIYKHINGVCGYCGAVQSVGNIFCTECGKKIGETCGICGHYLKKTDKYCPKCGNKRD